MELVPVILFGLLVVVAPVLGIAARSRLRRARMAAWRLAAEQAGLADLVGWGDSVLTGARGPLRAQVSTHDERETEVTRVEIAAPRLAVGLTLEPEGQGLLFRSRHPKEIEVGDDAFDRAVSVRGAPAVALALLDPDMRRTLRALVRGRLEVRDHRGFWASGRVAQGVLCVDLHERAPQARGPLHGEDPPRAGDAFLDGQYNLKDVLRASLDLATGLLTPSDLAGRLAANLASDAEASVRRRILLCLLREFPEAEATLAAVRRARDDEDAEVRVRAATALGADGREVLLGVAGGEGADDATSARAVAGLSASLSLEEAAGLLRSALRTRRLATARACLGALGGHGSAAVATLAKVLLVERGEVGEAAAEALATTDDAGAEAPLLRALVEGPLEVRCAAAAGLGRVGTRDAVAALREAEVADAALRAPARQAVALIQARLAGAAKGQLSLAGGEAGRLSLAEDESGRLSFVGGEPPPS